MTTNGILLDQHINFLVENNFQLLISLDGSESNNEYRLTKNNKNSYNIIIRNVHELKDKYPKYFESNVNFNAVLHNKNSINEIISHIGAEFGKTPTIAELNHVGVSNDKIEEFNRTYKNYIDDYDISNYCSTNQYNNFLLSPYNIRLSKFLQQFFNIKIDNYFEVINPKSSFIPTGTCLPFLRRFFVTVNGNILPCERIGHENVLGNVSNNKVQIDLEKICTIYNTYYNEIYSLNCNYCYNFFNCSLCVFTFEKNKCPYKMNKKAIEKYFSDNILELEKNPQKFYKIFNEINHE